LIHGSEFIVSRFGGYEGLQEKGSLASFSLIEFLAGSANDQLHGFCNNIPPVITGHQQVDMIGMDIFLSPHF